jgi:3D-(3,5/4)-trihydroxycyclohexane-1,2-dione acylhydrolase (decyclizing)
MSTAESTSKSRASRGGTVRLTAAQALVRWLQVQYSERDGETQRVIPAIFAIFGHGNVLGMGQALGQEAAELPLFQPKNEQAMVHTAIGYAKASRRLSTLACSASIGPGSTNMLSGAATAMVSRLPVLLLPSDTFATRRQGPVLQQLEHPVEADTSVNDLFRPVSRFFDRIARPEQLLTALPQALRVLLDPAEAGPVTVSLHQDVQGEAYDYPEEFFEPRVWPVSRRLPVASEVAVAASMLLEASRPLVVAGGGVRYSAGEAELARFAAELGVPVVETSAGKGSLTDSEWLLGGLGLNGAGAANEMARDADLVICAGTRLTDFTTASHTIFQHPEVRFVGVNVNPADAYKLSAAPIVADAREALSALRAAASGRSPDPQLAERVRSDLASWKSELEADIAPRPGERIGQGEVLKTLNQAVRPGDWVVASAGWQPGDLLKMYEVPPGSYTHLEFGFSCMGHEIPAGLGIRMQAGAGPEVFVVIGDGTYLMNPSELVTAVQEGQKLTVVILDNVGYQSIGRLADAATAANHGNDFRRRGADGRFPDGAELSVDFVANAASLGCESRLATGIDELAAALSEARASDRTFVIVCPTEQKRSLLGNGTVWDLGAPEVAEDERTQDLSSSQRAEIVARQRYLGA